MKYDLIVIDPPWPVKKIIRKSRPNQKENLDYKTMSVEDITNFPINNFADDNCSLFLWTTHKFLPISFLIMNSYGFKYQRCLTWDKKNGMCLFGFHHRTEFCLFGYRGKIDIYPKGKAIPTLINGKSERHSAKPDEFYDIIKGLGDKRIDLFARKKRDDWDVWGNEVDQ